MAGVVSYLIYKAKNMKKDKLMNAFSNKGMKARSKKTNSIEDLKNKKGIAPIDSGAMIALKGGDTGDRPRTVKTN